MEKSEMPLPLPRQEDRPLCHSSVWAQYRHEMHGIETIEEPYGFISFKMDGDICHIVDLFVARHARTGNARRALFTQMVEIAKARGAVQFIGNVEVSVNDSTRRIRFWLMMGAEVFKATNNVIYFVKRL